MRGMQEESIARRGKEKTKGLWKEENLREKASVYGTERKIKIKKGAELQQTHNSN